MKQFCRTFLFIFLFHFFIPALLVHAEKKDPGLQLLQPKMATEQQSVTEMEIRDIMGPVQLPAPPDYTYPLLIGIGLLLAAALLYYFRRRRQKAPPLTPAHIIALRELRELQPNMQPDQALFYADGLVAILRRYVQSRFQLNAGSQTSREFLQNLLKKGRQGVTFMERHRESLAQCIDTCDMAKFAHKVPEQKIMKEMEQIIRTFIESTHLETEQKKGENF